MDEGRGGCDYFSDGGNVAQQDTNGKSKPTNRLITRKRKGILGKSRKKREKKQETSVTGSRATAEDPEEEEEESSDLPPPVSSTSATDIVPKNHVKELKLRKTLNGKSSPNFSKIVESLSASPFVFQKRLSRLDWRKLHSVDVDKVVREVDLDALESVLDTITFADMQGEDTRNFSDANFIKVFRLAQLMVEYLLHVQELLASHKQKLLETGTQLQRRIEKHQQRQAKLHSELTVLRHEIKQAKKTNRAYEVMLRVQNKCQHRQQKLHESQREQQLQAQQQQVTAGPQTIRCCPLCDKMFESSYYLDLHVARRHSKGNEAPEDKISAAVSKAEEATAARIRAETSAALQAEVKLVQAMSQAELQRAQAVAQLQISSLEASLRESNAKLHDVENQILSQGIRQRPISEEKKSKDGKTEERLRDMDEQLHNLQHEMKHLKAENFRLVKELTSAHSKVRVRRSVSSEKGVSKDKNHWRRNAASSPERLESEGRGARYRQLIRSQSSSPPKRSKQRLQDDVPRTSLSPKKDRRPWTVMGKGQNISPKKHRKNKPQVSHSECLADAQISQQYKQWKVSQTSQQEGHQSPKEDVSHLSSRIQSPTSATDSSSQSPSGRQTPKSEVMQDIETGMLTPQLEARFKDAGDKNVAFAKAEIEKDLFRAGECRLSKEDGGKVSSKIATFESKFGTKTSRREEGESSRRSQEIRRSHEKMKERLEAKEKRTAEEALEEEARRKAENADAAAMDVGEDQPSILPSEKEKWLEEHPYKPIPQRPYVLSKYPHPPSVFSATRDELTCRLDEQLGGELKKFGFERDTAGISNSVYDAAKAALEKQHRTRISNLQLNQKKTIEYERGAILWQTQRAVRERDIQIIESHFEAESDQSSNESAQSQSPLEGETEDHSPLSQEEGNGWRDRSPLVRSSQTVRSPLSPLSPVSPHLQVHEQVKRETGHIAETLEALENVSGQKLNWARDRKNVTYDASSGHSPPQLQQQPHVNRFRDHRHGAPRSPPSQSPQGQGKVAADGKQTTKYLFPTIAKFKKAEESRFKYEDENQVEAFGLGQWDSEEDVPASASTTQR